MTAERDGGTTLGGFLEALAAGTPTPGGGGAAALLAATGAALVGMVCNLTVGRARFAAVEERMAAARDAAEGLRRAAEGLIAADAEAYGAVSAAFALPKGTEEEKAARKTRLQQALKGATEPPLRTADCAVAILRLCADVADGGNPSVLSDIAVGALAARAALDAAALNVRVNLHAIRDAAFVAAGDARLSAALAEGHALAQAALDRTARATGAAP